MRRRIGLTSTTPRASLRYRPFSVVVHGFILLEAHSSHMDTFAITITTTCPNRYSLHVPSKTACHSGATPCLCPRHVRFHAWEQIRKCRSSEISQKVVESLSRVFDNQLNHALLGRLVARGINEGRHVLTSGMIGSPSSPLTYRKGICVLSFLLILSSGWSRYGILSTATAIF